MSLIWIYLWFVFSLLYHLFRHVCNTGHIKKLLITSQRQVSAGIRRVTAITGNDAMSADYVANTLQQQITELSNKVSHRVGFAEGALKKKISVD